MRTRLSLLVVVVLNLLGVASCGGSASGPAAVRVGDVAITKATIDHWASVLSHEGQPDHRQTLQQKALAFLISSNWLIGTAAEHGLAPSGHEVDDGLEEERNTYVSPAEFTNALKAMGKVVADVRFEVQAKLATDRLRQMLINAQPKVSPAQIASYYGLHYQSFALREQRKFDIVNHMTLKEADKLKQEVEHGRNFSQMALHESLEVRRGPTPKEKRAAEHAIFAAKPHTLGGPVELFRFYSLFRVNQVIPPGHRPLRSVERAIGARIASEQNRRAHAEFLKAWISRWKARTDCTPAYVVEGCRQYRGLAAPEDPFGLGG